MSVNRAAVFFALDLDRTLFDTTANAGLFIRAVATASQEVAGTLTTLNDAATIRGESYSMWDMVKATLGEEGARVVKERYLEISATQEVLKPGAREFLEVLDSRAPAVRYGILTYGSAEGQTLKLQAGGIASLPHLITREKAKGNLIASWQQGEGFTLPSDLSPEGLSTDTVVLIDDRYRSFDGLPTAARGYWLRPSTGGVGTGETLPANVTVIRDLAQVISLEPALRG